MISKLINEAINKRKAALALCGILLMSSAPVYAQSAAEYPSQQAVSLGKLTATVAAIAGTGSGNQASAAIKNALLSADGASSEQGAALRSFRRLSSETVMATDKGDVTRIESEASDSAVTVKKRVYAGPGLGDCTVYMERITADSSSAGQTLTVFQLGEGQGIVRNYDILKKGRLLN